MSFAAAAYSGPVAVIDSATIDWGDGTAPTAGAVSSGPMINPPIVSTSFTPNPAYAANVTGSHLYAASGAYTVTTTAVAHIPGQPDQTLSATSTIEATAAYIGLNPPRTVHQAVGVGSDDAYAIFSTTIPDAEHALTATIDWGDGSAPTTGVVSHSTYFYGGRPMVAEGGLPSIDNVAVSGDHAYAAAGAYKVTITVDDGRGTSLATTGVAEVQESPLDLQAGEATSVIDPTGYGGGVPILSMATGSDLSVRNFTEADIARYSAVIDWGDGSASSAGTLSVIPTLPGNLPTHPQFGISGRHAFATAGDYTATITVTDDQGHTAQVTSTVHAVAETIHLDGGGFEAVQGPASGGFGFMAAYGWTSLTHDAKDITATIDWGDGSAPETVAVQTSPSFGYPTWISIPLVDHSYAAAGRYSLHVTVTTSSGLSATVMSTAIIDRFEGYSILPPITAGQSTDGLVLAHVRTPGRDASPGDYTATIDWGDGTAGSGTISVADHYDQPGWYPSPGNNVTLAVGGSHTYAAAGNYWLRVAVTDDLGETHTFFGNVVVSAANASTPPNSGGGGSSGPSGSWSAGDLSSKSVVGPIQTTTPPTNTVPTAKSKHAAKGHNHATQHVAPGHQHLHPAKSVVAPHPKGVLSTHRHLIR